MKTKPHQRDTRINSGQPLEVRARGDAESATIVGYAAVFDTEAVIAGMFREKFTRGAFQDSLKTSDIHALYNHDYGRVLGRSKSGSLRLEEDDHGLRIEIDLPNTQDAKDLETKIARGDIDEMSFQWNMVDGVEEWDDTGDMPVRTISKVGEMFDVSVCPRGAYPSTECGLRSLEVFKAGKNFEAARRRVRMKINLGLRDRENG